MFWGLKQSSQRQELLTKTARFLDIPQTPRLNWRFWYNNNFLFELGIMGLEWNPSVAGRKAAFRCKLCLPIMKFCSAAFGVWGENCPMAVRKAGSATALRRGRPICHQTNMGDSAESRMVILLSFLECRGLFEPHKYLWARVTADTKDRLMK